MRATLVRLLERPRNRWLLLAGALAVALAGALASEYIHIRRDLDAGRAILDEIDLTTIDEQGGLAVVAGRATEHLDAAAHRARTSPVFRLLAPVPIVGTQIDAVRDMTETVADLGRHGRAAAIAIDESLDAGSGPAGRLQIVRTARAELDRLRAYVEGVELGAGGWLVPQVRNARRTLSIELADARSDLARSSALAASLEEFLVGPRRYLVLGGNNAEMRAVGIPTTSGLATIADGAIDVGDFSGATDQIELPEPGVPVPVEYEALYGWLNGDRGYRTAVATANWPLAAEIMAEITARNVYGPVDGIIYVDTVTLGVLLDVIGPVEVEGNTYTSENILNELLYRNYLRFQTAGDNPERKALQSKIAQAIFDELDRREYSVLELAGRLSQMAHSRHLLGYSTDLTENRLWQAFGADGALRPDGITVVSQELGASKLDFFVTLEVEAFAELRDSVRHVTLEIRITNQDHGETSPYIDGGGFYARPGEYGSFLVTYLPQGAYDLRSDAGITHYGRDGPLFAIASILRVPEGTTETVRLEFSVPEGQDILRVIPSARLWPTRWIVGDLNRLDDQPFDIDLRDAERPPARRG